MNQKGNRQAYRLFETCVRRLDSQKLMEFMGKNKDKHRNSEEEILGWVNIKNEKREKRREIERLID